jgi:ATP-dependent protease HslVU (ClpYQ) peptidase subunit
MSVVVYKDGRMAADSRAYSGSTHPIGNKRKIHRLKDGSLLGITSNQVGIAESFRDWLDDGANREAAVPHEPSFNAIHVKPNGDVYLYDDGYAPSGPIKADFYAIGSGGQYAYGAMTVGVEVEEAVSVAIKCDIWCGGHVDLLELERG